MPLSGVAVAEVGMGGLLLYSGIKGYSLADTFSYLVKGKTPANTEPISQQSFGNPAASGTGSTGTAAAGAAAGADAGASMGTAVANEALAKQILNQEGLSSWTTGQEWQDLVSLWNKESGWSNTAENASSGAYGIAQALQGSPGSEYQGYLSPAQDQAASQGNAGDQILWGIKYIEQRYGSPTMAWAHEQANNWY